MGTLRHSLSVFTESWKLPSFLNDDDDDDVIGMVVEEERTLPVRNASWWMFGSGMLVGAFALEAWNRHSRSR